MKPSSCKKPTKTVATNFQNQKGQERTGHSSSLTLFASIRIVGTRLLGSWPSSRAIPPHRRPRAPPPARRFSGKVANRASLSLRFPPSFCCLARTLASQHPGRIFRILSWEDGNGKDLSWPPRSLKMQFLSTDSHLWSAVLQSLRPFPSLAGELKEKEITSFSSFCREGARRWILQRRGSALGVVVEEERLNPVGVLVACVAAYCHWCVLVPSLSMASTNFRTTMSACVFLFCFMVCTCGARQVPSNFFFLVTTLQPASKLHC